MCEDVEGITTDNALMQVRSSRKLPQEEDFYRLSLGMSEVRNASLSLLSMIQKDSAAEYYIYLSSVLMNRSNTDKVSKWERLSGYR